MIIIETEMISGGLFAQIFNRILEILHRLKEHNIYPLFKIHSRLYGLGESKNIIPHLIMHNYNYETNNNKQCDNILFELFPYENKNNDYVFKLVDIRRKWRYTLRTLEEGNKLFFEYFVFPNKIMNDVEHLYKLYFNDKKVLGFHYRATDKMGAPGNYGDKGYCETYYFQLRKTVDILRKELKILNTNTIFVACDNKSVLNTLSDEIENINIISIDYNFPHNNGTPIHSYGAIKSDNDKLNMGISAIIDTMLLSKCNKLIKYGSQMSAYAVLINPKLEAVRLNRTNYNWYPESHIKQYVD